MADYDIVIMGAGVVGLTFAAAVAKLPIKVAIIEQKEHSSAWCKTDYPQRVSAITPGSEFALKRLGIWPSIVEQRISRFTKTFVWDSAGLGEIEFSAAELGLPYLGHIVENEVLVNALWQHCSAQKNITIYEGLKVNAFYPETDGAELITESHTFKSQLMVAADGAHSWLRQQAGIEQNIKPYQHTAIVATVATQESHSNTAWQHFLATGPLAFLPFTQLTEHQHLCSIVWSTLPSLADELMALPSSEFNRRLTEAFDYRLGEVEIVTPRVAFPLVMRQAKKYFANNVVLVGDAAHTIHPLAGQGMNLGIMDACQLAEKLELAVSQNRPLNSEQMLLQYARSQRTENQIMASVMQSFKSLFSVQTGFIPTVRGMGLNLTDQCQPIKHLLLRRAMGLVGNKPKIAMFDPQLLQNS